MAASGIGGGVMGKKLSNPFKPNTSFDDVVKVSIKEGKISNVYFVDVLGRLFSPVLIENSENEVTIQVTDLTKGLYKVIINLADGSQRTQNFQRQ